VIEILGSWDDCSITIESWYDGFGWWMLDGGGVGSLSLCGDG
jgi:hypothetical protein